MLILSKQEIARLIFRQPEWFSGYFFMEIEMNEFNEFMYMVALVSLILGFVIALPFVFDIREWRILGR